MKETINNAVMTLPIFRKGGTWMFNDPGRELYEEPFVGMANLPFEFIYFDKNGVHARDGDEITIYFSENEIPNYNIKAEHTDDLGENKGDMYKMFINRDTVKRQSIQHLEQMVPGIMQNGQEFWLCPALLKFFNFAPKRIYVSYLNTPWV